MPSFRSFLDPAITYFSKPLPADLTSYDLLKTLAVVLMIVDHIGLYFFPDNEWFRVFGRMCVPIWFFLIGYAQTRHIPAVLVLGALVLMAANPVAGLPLFPLNILLSFILIRLALNPLMDLALRDRAHYWAICAALFFLAVPTEFLIEYGTGGVLLAMFGHIMRHQDRLDDENFPVTVMAVTVLSFIAVQTVMMGFSVPQFFVMAVGVAAVGFVLFQFQPQIYGDLTRRLPRPAVRALQIGGRYTLEIYVAHLVLFKILALFLGDDRFRFLHFHIF